MTGKDYVVELGLLYFHNPFFQLGWLICLHEILYYRSDCINIHRCQPPVEMKEDSDVKEDQNTLNLSSHSHEAKCHVFLLIFNLEGIMTFICLFITLNGMKRD